MKRIIDKLRNDDDAVVIAFIGFCIGCLFSRPRRTRAKVRYNYR